MAHLMSSETTDLIIAAFLGFGGAGFFCLALWWGTRRQK